jgi:LysR family hydrogen peroxide-inducible transcriptional activator
MHSVLPSIGGVTLTQLAYAVAIDAHRHFGQAAAACHVTQPTLSMQLRKLEGALGVTLFDRSRTPVVPTEVGARVDEQARAVLREAARLGDIVDGGAGEVVGQLRLGVIPTLAPYLLPRTVGALARAHPRLELVVEEYITDDVVARVQRGSLDAGLVASPVASATIAEQPLFTEPFVAYVAPGHRLAAAATVSPDDLSLDDLWLLSDGHCLRDQAVALCNHRPPRGARATERVPASARFESGNLETLKRLVEQDVGMTLLPALAATDLHTDAQRRLLRPFTGPAPSRDVRLVRRREQGKQRLIDAVVGVVVEVLPDSVQKAGRK